MAPHLPHDHSPRIDVARFAPALVLAGVLIGLSVLLRIALALRPEERAQWVFPDILGSFLVGGLFDLAAATYYIAPLVLYLLLAPDRLFRWRWHRPLLYAFLLGSIYGLCFNTLSEWMFWEEFGTRFNFIAVDYLIYTTEVIGNIRQSYPVGLLMTGVLAVTCLLLWWLRMPVHRALSSPSRFRRRLPLGVVLLALPFATYALIEHAQRDQFESERLNELAGNGIYDFFAALRNKELDYRKHYANLPDAEAFAKVRKALVTPDARLADDSPFGIERIVSNPGPEKRWNVVFVSVESLSAEYLTTFGNKEGLTPVMDKLAGESLFFTRLYATGTRTVRGLEALTMSLPPTPGESIVKRPGNENLFTIGKVFRDKGYDTKWVYGGYGYFDNMNGFYAGSGYQVVDRTDIPKERIHHENIWGIADEDLFDQAIAELDRSHGAGRPAFLHVMTTSNHRPYTYPEGRIDIPSGQGRAGAVKYTDYAIGHLIEAAKKKSWFDNTVFVIVADHCARSSGASELPVKGYHIPMFIYAPKLVKPARVDRLMSQIDVAPTLLGLLDFSYRSKFFGYDIMRLEPGRERVFLGTYQNVGLLESEELAVLSPRRAVKTLAPEMQGGGARRIEHNKALEERAISWYQAASYAFRNGQLRNPPTK